ncbi:alpha/beta fold hydrolase [Sphingobium boeckii]|uniref:Pimeloyl-ACP methyl ester carboxylesterase n=1 Tax=Sphingobium boeckii TaxID=1082345 RepID=A0A7W9EG55_9SPHN|nr:alpha/beta hydrolase [Sphingobium boeckii]MBB5686391.1 pimeloyl-ACP methyl ester carboxylesterase [Sphingobium boeckii]
MREIRKGYVDATGGQIHYHSVAGSEPAIIFLHQTASSARSYDPLLEALTLPNRLIALDTPGFGNSADLGLWPSLQDYAAFVVEAADALSISRFHLFGHHTGATLAIEIAAAWPEGVLSLMLSGPVFMTVEEQARFIEHYEAPISPVRDGSHLATNWGYAASNNPTCAVDLLQDAVVDLLHAWRARPKAYMAVARHDTAARARDVHIPTLLLTAPGDFFYETFDRARAIFPKATVATTAGDNFQATADPQGVAAAIQDFLGAARL